MELKKDSIPSRAMSHNTRPVSLLLGMDNDNVEFKNFLNPFIDDHNNHRMQLPILEECCTALSDIANAMDPSNSDLLKYRIKKVQCAYLLTVLIEVNMGIIQSLKGDMFTVAEALSRIAMEHAVNLMFVLEDEEQERAKSLLKHYIVESKNKAIKWLNYSEKIDDVDAIKHANIKISHFERIERENKDLVDKKIKGWKNARQRFSDIGVEKLYHVLFSSSSDSVHSLSEDIFNLTLINNYPRDIRRIGMDGFRAEKLSFSLYLSINAVSFFGEAMARLAIKMGEDALEVKIIKIGEKLKRLVDRHNELTELYHENTQS